MEHISPQSVMTRSTMSPDPMYDMDEYLCPPAGSLSVTKPVKKRKSWGQELPEPKTALPPRKRAKTQDEKEQRRIERIKRNRAAAHNSRERKRVEAELLANANEGLQKQLQYLKQRVALQDAQLAKCREQLGGTLPEVTIEDSNNNYNYHRSSSERRSVSLSPSASSTIDPRAALSCGTPSTSPETTPYIKHEHDMSESIHDEAALFDSLDLTQHSAAMLCDLQCQSTGSTTTTSQLSPLSTFQTWLWTRIMFSMMQLSILGLYRTTLIAMWTHSPARMNRLLATLAPGSTLTAPQLPSTIRSPTPSTLWWTLAQHFLLATGPSKLGSSALALSGVCDASQSPVAWSSGRSTDKSLLDHSVGHPHGIDGDRDRDPEHAQFYLKAFDVSLQRDGDGTDHGIKTAWPRR